MLRSLLRPMTSESEMREQLENVRKTLFWKKLGYSETLKKRLFSDLNFFRRRHNDFMSGIELPENL